MTLPPKIADQKSPQRALVLNLVIPGAGQFYLGQRVLGGALIVSTLICFGGLILQLVMGCIEFVRRITEGAPGADDVWIQMLEAFPCRSLLLLLAVLIGLYLLSIAVLPFRRANR
jgi:TM2 domain-containing membrane protein YozV